MAVAERAFALREEHAGAARSRPGLSGSGPGAAACRAAGPDSAATSPPGCCAAAPVL